MIWYFLVALNFMVLAVLAARFQAQAPVATQRLTLTRKAALLMVLMNGGFFYPLLIAYFQLYPVSSPHHFSTSMLLWFISLNGVGLALFARQLIDFSSTRPFTRAELFKRLLLLVATALAAGALMQREMASGSLFSAWTPLFCLLASGLSYGVWSCLLQIPVQIRLRQQGVR